MDQLTKNSSYEFIQSILQDGEVVPELRELILTRTGGNPLFLEEFTHSLVESGIIEKKDNQYILTRKASEVEVPDTVQGIIAARMDRLEDDLKRIMQIAAVIGRDFAFRILQSITGMENELKSFLLSLQGLEFIYEKRVLPELEYIFKHALIQEVAYNSLLVTIRKDIHLKIAQAIEAIYSERLEEFYEMLAYHYSKTDQPDKAYKYLRLAGEKAVKNNSTWEAFDFFRQALKELNQLSENRENILEKVQVFRLITSPMRLLGYPEDSLFLLQEGEKLSRNIKDERNHSIIYSRLGNYYTVKEGRPLLGIEHSAKSFLYAENTQDIELIARNGWDLSAAFFIAGQFANSIEVTQKVISSLYENNKKTESFGSGMNLFAGLHGYCGLSMGWLGSFDNGESLLEEGLRFAAEIDDRPSLGLVHWFYGWSFCVKGNGEKAIEHFESAIRHIEDVKWRTLLGLAWAGLGWGYCLTMQFDAAKKHIENGLRIHTEEKIAWWLAPYYMLLSIVNYDLGDFGIARENVTEAIRLAQENYERHWEACSKVFEGRILGKLETSHEIGKRHTLLGVNICDEFKLKPILAQAHFYLGELDQNRDRSEQAAENLKKAEVMFRQMGMGYWLTKTREALGKL